MCCFQECPGCRAGRRLCDGCTLCGTTHQFRMCTWPLGGALSCDATLVSPLTRTGQPCAAATDGAALRGAERRKRAACGPQHLLVLGAEVGGRWNEGALRLLRDLSACEFNVPRPLSAKQQRRFGQGGGGHSWTWPCNRPSPARRSATLGPRPHARASHRAWSSTRSCTWPSRRGRHACRLSNLGSPQCRVLVVELARTHLHNLRSIAQVVGHNEELPLA